jgi:hypothetical protein
MFISGIRVGKVLKDPAMMVFVAEEAKARTVKEKTQTQNQIGIISSKG